MKIIKTIVMIPVKTIAAFMFFVMSLGNRVIQTLLGITWIVCALEVIFSIKDHNSSGLICAGIIAIVSFAVLFAGEMIQELLKCILKA